MFFYSFLQLLQGLGVERTIAVGANIGVAVKFEYFIIFLAAALFAVSPTNCNSLFPGLPACQIERI